ncbi:MerR family DNA-binding transcriptional regulator [Pseudonocardia phyllosphaerae]|uniref:MerR family DNA-binding transcriptional regulator n=1 Tax=Pseudonocardia phyllosphaerae TaxID=3390502 RepID=UPI003979AB27
MSTDDHTVAIGAAAALFGLAPSTLRWWERHGVLPAAPRTGGRRRYDRRELRRIGLAHLCRISGDMTLTRTAAVVSAGTTHAAWQGEVRGELRRLDAEIARLDTAREHLRHLLQCVDDDPAADCPFLDDLLARDTPRGRFPERDPLVAARSAAAAPAGAARDGSAGFRHDERRRGCLQCGTALTARSTGRRASYCSAACRQRAYRRRHGVT